MPQAQKGLLAILNASEEDYNKLADAINNADGAAAIYPAFASKIFAACRKRNNMKLIQKCTEFGDFMAFLVQSKLVSKMQNIQRQYCFIPSKRCICHILYPHLNVVAIAIPKEARIASKSVGHVINQLVAADHACVYQYSAQFLDVYKRQSKYQIMLPR